MSHRPGLFILCLLAAHLLPLPQAAAVITRLTPLKSIIDDSDRIALATIEAIDPDRPSLTLAITTDLKGTLATRKLPVLLKGDSEGNPKQVLDRVSVGTAVIVFITELPDRHMALVFTEGSWFQFIGQLVEGSPRWSFTHGEPYLRRTFKGTTEEMKNVVVAYVKDMTPPPAVSPDEKPGFGPVREGVIETPEPVKDNTKPEAPAKQTKDDATAKNASPPSIAPTAEPPSDSIMPWVLGATGFVLAAALALSLRKKPKR